MSRTKSARANSIAWRASTGSRSNLACCVKTAKIKAYGTGLLSSAGELAEMHKAELRPLDLEVAANHVYDPTHYQSILFCADSFDEMYEAVVARDYSQISL